jgi:hypothetical protein
MRTDGQTDMTKQIVAFRNFANAPNKLPRGIEFLLEGSIKEIYFLVLCA